MIAATLLALSLAACPREPPRHDSTFTITCSVCGKRREIYGWCPSRVVDTYRVRKLSVVRDQFGMVQEVIDEYSEPRIGVEWKRRWFAAADRRFAVRDFVRWGCIADCMVEYSQGDSVRRIPLSRLLNPDAMIGDTWFLEDKSEWLTHTVKEEECVILD